MEKKTEILLSYMLLEKAKIEVLNSVFRWLRKTEYENTIWNSVFLCLRKTENENWNSNFVFKCRRKTAGTRVHEFTSSKNRKFGPPWFGGRLLSCRCLRKSKNYVGLRGDWHLVTFTRLFLSPKNKKKKALQRDARYRCHRGTTLFDTFTKGLDELHL